MGKHFFMQAIRQVLLAVFVYTVFSLFALALFAIFVKAFTLPQTAVTAVNWAVKCVGVFLTCVFCLRGERLLFKGIAAGILGCLAAMLVFAAVGGGFSLGVFYLAELLICAVLGGAGALLGGKLRKA